MSMRLVELCMWQSLNKAVQCMDQQTRDCYKAYICLVKCIGVTQSVAPSNCHANTKHGCMTNPANISAPLCNVYFVVNLVF
jgi:hypothetical protein